MVRKMRVRKKTGATKRLQHFHLKEDSPERRKAFKGCGEQTEKGNPSPLLRLIHLSSAHSDFQITLTLLCSLHQKLRRLIRYLIQNNIPFNRCCVVSGGEMEIIHAGRELEMSPSTNLCFRINKLKISPQLADASLYRCRGLSANNRRSCSSKDNHTFTSTFLQLSYSSKL